MWKTGVSSHVQHWHRLKMAAKCPGEKQFSTGTWRPWFKREIVNNKHPFSIRCIEGSIWKGSPFNLNLLWFPLCHPTPFPAFVGGYRDKLSGKVADRQAKIHMFSDTSMKLPSPKIGWHFSSYVYYEYIPIIHPSSRWNRHSHPARRVGPS